MTSSRGPWREIRPRDFRMRVHSRAASMPSRRVAPDRRSRSRCRRARSSRPTRRRQTWTSTVMVEPITAEHSPVLDLRQRLSAALESGSADAIAFAYLELARGLADDHQHEIARSELEEGVQRLTKADGTGPVWRLLLALATLHEQHGRTTSARLAARAAQEEATKAGSTEGRMRAEQLCARLWQRVKRDRRPSP